MQLKQMGAYLAEEQQPFTSWGSSGQSNPDLCAHTDTFTYMYIIIWIFCQIYFQHL